VRHYTRLRVEVTYSASATPLRRASQLTPAGPLRRGLPAGAAQLRHSPGLAHVARAADAAGNQQRVRHARAFGLEQWYRVSVPGDGLYAITCADLAGAGINAAVQLATVRILAGGIDGAEIPLLITNHNNSLFCDQDDL
jgi:hypothetical protein